MTSTTLISAIKPSGGLIQTGPFGSQLHQHEYVNEGIPVVMPKDIRDGRIDSSSIARITPSKADALSRHRLSVGDIVFPRRGDIGKSALVSESEAGYLCGTGCLKVVVPPEAYNSEFLNFYLSLPFVGEWLQNHAVGTTMLNLNTEILGRLPVPLVERRRQDAVVQILRPYNSLIDSNRRRIKLLEEAARLLYREWFVRLRFPGREATSSSDGLADGWNHAPLSSIATVVRGRSYKGSELSETEGRQFVNLKCFVRYGGFRESGLKRYTGPFKEKQCVEPGDIVMAVTDMTQERMIVAQAARIPKTVEPGAVISMDVVKLEPGIDTDKDWFYFFLRFSGFSELVSRYGTGATVVHLSPSLIESHVCVVPRKEIQVEFGELVRPILNQIDVLLAQNNALEKARDLLLPRLMSGEIVV